MSVNDSLPESKSRLADLPTFELSFAIDDETNPAWVTVYSAKADEIDTHWISIDVAYAIDLAKVA